MDRMTGKRLVAIAWLVSMVGSAGAQEFATPKDRPATPPGAGITALRSPDMQDPTNAALRHYRAWTMARTDNLTEFDELWKNESELKPGWQPSAKLREMMGTLGDYIATARLAAELRDADWGVEYSDGFMAILPHLGLLRREAKVLEMAARVELASGPQADRVLAARSLAACFRLGRHPISDKTVISTLVGGAIANRAALATGALLDQGLIGPAEAAIILEGARALDASDPFNFDGALRGEMWLAASAFAKTGPDAGKQAGQVARELVSMNQADASLQEVVRKIERMDEQTLRDDVLKHGAFFAIARQAVKDGGPDAPAKLADLEKRAVAGEFGVTLQLTAPSIATGYKSNQKNKDAVAAIVSRLEAVK